MKRIIWLLGENDSKTINNNSYYFFKETCNIRDEIDKYYILEKNKKNVELVKQLPKNISKKIVWKNSLKHWRLYFKSDLHIVTLSYKDVVPLKLLFKDIKMRVKTPIIYLQHGTIAIKKLGYHGHSYCNNLFRFFVYNKEILQKLEQYNDFKPYQLYYAKYHPRYMELIKRNESAPKNQILYFLTWREYLGDNLETEELLNVLEQVVTNKELIKYLKNQQLQFKICLHQFFDEQVLKGIYPKLDSTIFKIVTPASIDVMDELAQSKLLITDYSSVGFDFTFLNKPVILFAPDFDKYLEGREIYCDRKEFEKTVLKDVKSLIKEITNENYQINKFFKDRLPEKIDYKYVKEGKHIINMYGYLREKSLNKISFVGYKFGGSGGTVSATKSLAEKLMERGYLVELVSLNGTLRNQTEFPNGVNEIKLSRRNNQFYTRISERTLRKLTKYKWLMGIIKYDNCYKHLVVTIGRRLNKYLKNTTARTVISTRESLHPYLSKIKNTNIENKIFFFHTDANSFENIFSDLKPILEKNYYQKCIFVSESNLKKYQEKFNLNMGKYIVIGNTLESNRIISREKIVSPKKKDKYVGISLSRLSSDRISDIDNMIKFGKKLKEKKINNLQIDIYGNGNQADYLKSKITEYDLSKYLVYQGHTTTPFNEIIRHDFLVDFSVNQSFGMIYIEGILAGKKVYATKNDGSMEVLAQIADSIYDNQEELLKYLEKIDKISLEELQGNYDKIISKYGSDKITDEFIRYLNDK